MTTMRRRPIRRVVIVLPVLVIAFTVALWPVYVAPQTDAPRKADAIVVLGGAHDGREELGLKLAHDGYAPRVVFSNPYKHSPMINRICHGGYSFEVDCFAPDPPTTRGEAIEIARLTEQHHWTRVIVVTFTPHISRARYIIEKCYGGQLIMVNKPADISPARWAYNFLYQTAGYVRAYFESC